ncbi:oligosaccharide flippase family protein [Actinomycetes bacterium M1A6_2h]
MADSAENDSRAAAKNTAAMLASRLVIAVMGWAGTVLIARALSPESFGQFSFVFGLLGVLSIVTDLGVGRVVLAKLVDANPWDVQLVSTAFISLRMALGLLGYVAAVLYVVLLGYPTEVILATVVAGLVVVVATPSHALSVLYQSRLKMTFVAAAESFGQLCQFVVTIAAVLFAPYVLILVLPALVNEVVVAYFKVRGVRRGIAGPRPAGRAQFFRWREMLREAIPLSIGFALITLLSKIDVLILGQIDSFDSVGLYSVGYKFSDLVQMVGLAVVTPITALLVASWPGSMDLFRQRARTSVVILTLIGASGLAAFYPSATALLTTMYGDRFGTADTATRMLVIGAVFAAVTGLGLMVLVSAGKQKVYPWVALGALVINVAANLVVIPLASFTGAAYVTLGTEVLLFVAIWTVVFRTIPMRKMFPFLSFVSIGVLTAVVTTAGVYAVDHLGVPWLLVSIVAGLLVFVAAPVLRLTDGMSLKQVIRLGG